MTPWNTPFDVDVAIASLLVPPVGAITVSDGMLTRAQADQELTEVKSHIDDIVNGSFRGPGEMREHRFGAGPARGSRLWWAPA